jgi:hypothetical protein
MELIHILAAKLTVVQLLSGAKTAGQLVPTSLLLRTPWFDFI